MADQPSSPSSIMEELRGFVESSFPKKCSCGKVYNSLSDYLSETTPPPKAGSFLAEINDPQNPLVDFVRNCTCGSTLMTIISERRDISETGVNRRKKFDDLLNLLVEKGLTRENARQELLKALKGEKSSVFESLK